MGPLPLQNEEEDLMIYNWPPSYTGKVSAA